MHTCGQSKKKKKGKKPREQQHVNEKQNKTILQLWPKHCCWCCLCCFVCVFFCFSAVSFAPFADIPHLLFRLFSTTIFHIPAE